MSKLVIVESPTKVKSIKKYLGKGYDVMASMGHIRDLPKSKIGVDEANNFEPEYINIRGKAKLINELKKDYNVIVSGRSVVKIYPELDYHFFIVADLDERVRRKCMQYENKETFEDIKNNISKRDELQRQAGFYEYAEMTIEVDVTDCKTVEESSKKVLNYIKVPEMMV